jgi:hypothetical protein
MLKLDEKESGQTTGCISYMRINHDQMDEDSAYAVHQVPERM